MDNEEQREVYRKHHAFANEFVRTLNPIEAAKKVGIEDIYDVFAEDMQLQVIVKAAFDRQCILWDAVPVAAIRYYLFDILTHPASSSATRVRAAQVLLESAHGGQSDGEKFGEVLRALKDL